MKCQITPLNPAAHPFQPQTPLAVPVRGEPKPKDTATMSKPENQGQKIDAEPGSDPVSGPTPRESRQDTQGQRDQAGQNPGDRDKEPSQGPKAKIESQNGARKRPEPSPVPEPGPRPR